MKLVGAITFDVTYLEFRLRRDVGEQRHPSAVILALPLAARGAQRERNQNESSPVT